MKNSQWFWLSICVLLMFISFFLFYRAYAIELSAGQLMAHVMPGVIMLAFSVFYIAFEIVEDFDKWLDSL